MADTISKIDTKNRERNIAALAALQNKGITQLKPDTEELSDCYIKSNDTVQLILSEGDISKCHRYAETSRYFSKPAIECIRQPPLP